MVQQVSFPSGTVDYLFNSSFSDLWSDHDPQQAVIITNEYIALEYSSLLKGMKVIALPVGESSKDLHTIGGLCRQLSSLGATRGTLLVGLGGGVVTDITGFAGSVYMRGVPFGFVPTTLLGMVDAAIGGKNGVNLGMGKNMIGTITQPRFILYDNRFLDTLPDDEWSNGFAEIIKYGCIFDAALYNELDKNNISFYKDTDDDALAQLIKKCVDWKNKTVQEDEQEKGIRKLLNFGHTAAHAIENLYDIPHGKAVAIGMVIASMISAQVAGLDKSVTDGLRQLLTKYHLPVRIKLDAAKAMEILKMDKKRTGGTVDYILLEKIGHAVIRPLSLDIIEQALNKYAGNS